MPNSAQMAAQRAQLDAEAAAIDKALSEAVESKNYDALADCCPSLSVTMLSSSVVMMTDR
ncbi:hypothetical protein GO011_07015 [Mycobacterium sp. 20091114027_K0903767]|nr:hypothetical protein [Mycobacterium sp. 20091114027_K0903767]